MGRWGVSCMYDGINNTLNRFGYLIVDDDVFYNGIGYGHERLIHMGINNGTTKTF